MLNISLLLCPNLKTSFLRYLDEVIEGASVNGMFSFPNEGISGFLFAASRAAAEGDKRPGGADRTEDIQPPQSESILILSFDELILQMIIVICRLLNHFMKSFDALMTLLTYFCRKGTFVLLKSTKKHV